MQLEEEQIEISPELAVELRDAGVTEVRAESRQRVLFVGQLTYFGSSALNQSTAAIEPHFVDFRSGADKGPLIDALEQFRPDVVIVFRPEIIPAGLFHSTPALTVGILTEPLPRPSVDDEHPDLARRLAYLKAIDPSNFDRVISFDPLVVESASAFTDIWRSMPLPVADEHFRPVERWDAPPRPVFMGRSTRHREAWLLEAKHEYDLLHIAHGVFGDELLELLSRPSLSINIHNEAYPTFEVRVPLCLAAGNLVASEALSPTHGLEADVDFLELMHPSGLVSLIFQLISDPNVYHQVRVMGRMKAEAFRASRVFKRMIEDLLIDVANFGRGQRVQR